MIMYLCDRGIECTSSCVISIGYSDSSDNVVLPVYSILFKVILFWSIFIQMDWKQTYRTYWSISIETD